MSEYNTEKSYLNFEEPEKVEEEESISSNDITEDSVQDKNLEKSLQSNMEKGFDEQ